MYKSVIQILTLVDITATGVIRSIAGQELVRNQQRNYETVLQVLSLRTQPHLIDKPKKIEISEFQTNIIFSDFYAGKQSVWCLRFTADHLDAYATEEGPLNGLIQDFKEVPIITGLTETAKFMLPIFYTQGAIKNIHFIQLTNE